MGLLSVLKKQRQREKEMRFLMLGLDNAGKTTILRRIHGDPIDEIAPTLGFNIKTLNHEGYSINVWDVGGQKSLRSFWRNYFESTDAVIWVVDAADRARLADCKEELFVLLQEERLIGASLLVFANKQDLEGAASDEEIAKALDLASIRSHRWKVLGCSAVTGKHLLDGLDWVVKDVAARIYMYSE
ncbi:MAG: putative ADP-ribosylation factor-like 2-like protein [Piptocephalis tieghemiana]|nr:MAG: putative ADP-ribosylation factor-like 2-like protein [Piptocephalis tieghemiana]